MVAGAEMVVTPVALALTSLSSEKKRLRLFCGNVPTFPAKCFDFSAEMFRLFFTPSTDTCRGVFCAHVRDGFFITNIV